MRISGTAFGQRTSKAEALKQKHPVWLEQKDGGGRAVESPCGGGSG